MEKITFIKETVDVISNDTNGKIHIGTLYTSITLSKQQLRKYPRFSIIKRGEFYDFLQPSLVSTDFA